MLNKSPREGADTIMLSVEEVCQICSFGRTTFYKYLKLGKVPARKFGTRTVVLRDELAEAIKSLPRAGGAS
jgi:excisionase family DNA binding protein